MYIYIFPYFALCIWNPQIHWKDILIFILFADICWQWYHVYVSFFIFEVFLFSWAWQIFGVMWCAILILFYLFRSICNGNYQCPISFFRHRGSFEPRNELNLSQTSKFDGKCCGQHDDTRISYFNEKWGKWWDIQ